MGKIFLDDLQPGREFVSSRRTLTEADILWFSGISGDYSPLHSDETFVKESTAFRGRICQGWLVVGVQSGLRSELRDWAIQAYLAIECRWRDPAYPGDTIQSRYRVTEVRRSRSNLDRGIVTLTSEVVNQDGGVIQEAVETFLVTVTPRARAATS